MVVTTLTLYFRFLLPFRGLSRSAGAGGFLHVAEWCMLNSLWLISWFAVCHIFIWDLQWKPHRGAGLGSSLTLSRRRSFESAGIVQVVSAAS